MTNVEESSAGPVEIHGPFRIIRPGGRGMNWGDYEHVLGLSNETVGARGLSMDLQTIPPGAESPIHLHTGFEAGLFILSGRIVHRFGAGMRLSVESGPGEFIYVEPDVPHQSLNPSDIEPVVLIVARTTADGHAGNVVVESNQADQ
ncbi:MAG: cupin domain-containing protein [Nitrolancea sp.]